MANIDAPQGLVKVRGPSDVRSMYINSSYATALFVGDPVIKVAGGSNAAVVKSGTMTHDIGTLPEIEKAAAGDANKITGVIVGFEHKCGTTGVNKHNPASTEAVALVECHPDAVYEIQADGAVAAATVGLNAVLIYTHAGSTVTGKSGVELDTTSDVPAADASNQLLIVGISKNPDRNDVGSAYTLVEVKLNTMTDDTRDVLGI